MKQRSGRRPWWVGSVAIWVSPVIGLASCDRAPTRALTSSASPESSPSSTHSAGQVWLSIEARLKEQHLTDVEVVWRGQRVGRVLIIQIEAEGTAHPSGSSSGIGYLTKIDTAAGSMHLQLTLDTDSTGNKIPISELLISATIGLSANSLHSSDLALGTTYAVSPTCTIARRYCPAGQCLPGTDSSTFNPIVLYCAPDHTDAIARTYINEETP